MGNVRDLQEALASAVSNPATPFVIVTPTGTVCEFDRIGFIPGEGVALYTKKRLPTVRKVRK